MKNVPGGLLGADFEIANGRYRIKKVFGGLNWNPQLRAPLTEPGVNGKAGEYLLAVNGRDVRPPSNLYSFFENTSGKIIDITLGANADPLLLGFHIQQKAASTGEVITRRLEDRGRARQHDPVPRLKGHAAPATRIPTGAIASAARKTRRFRAPENFSPAAPTRAMASMPAPIRSPGWRSRRARGGIRSPATASAWRPT